VARRDSGELTVRTAVGELRVALGTDAPEASRRDRFNVAIRPEKIVLRSPQDGDGADTVRVRVDEVIYIGAETHYILSAGGQKFRAEMMNTKVGPQGFELGQEVLAHFPPAALMVLDD
jgi:ABC-type Fe3+/spermidine/putrescine transport system ATPase subunit